MRKFDITQKWVQDQLSKYGDGHEPMHQPEAVELTAEDSLYLNDLAAKLGEPQVF